MRNIILIFKLYGLFRDPCWSVLYTSVPFLYTKRCDYFFYVDDNDVLTIILQDASLVTQMRNNFSLKKLVIAPSPSLASCELGSRGWNFPQGCGAAHQWNRQDRPHAHCPLYTRDITLTSIPLAHIMQAHVLDVAELIWSYILILNKFSVTFHNFSFLI